MQTKIDSSCIEFPKLKKARGCHSVQSWSRAGGEGSQAFLLTPGPGLLCPTRLRSPLGLECGSCLVSQPVLDWRIKAALENPPKGTVWGHLDVNCLPSVPFLLSACDSVTVQNSLSSCLRLRPIQILCSWCLPFCGKFCGLVSFYIFLDLLLK